ncbi:hypothetical protein [Pseudomonas paralcaligenes]|uniref:hypothetical protein n=1 Tax=Pseudomonas paralcaligenes TaxID=2772558 RepID=UPI001C820D25|nr:hypothetical protein [Pseudomonas paralcaligenes]
MELKLGASLWLALPDAKPMAPQLEQGKDLAGDFGKKLGLPVAQVTPPEVEAPKIPRPQPLDELYVWGGLAGHHLSYMPGSFGVGAVSPATPSQAQASSVAQEAVALRGTDPLLRSTSGSPETAAPLSLPRGPQSAMDPMKPLPEQGHLAAFLTQRWPERRLLLLPRDDGTEVIIRDFHLSEEEQNTLARDLQQFLHNTGEPLGQIWANGRLVWRREPIQ